MGFFNKIGKAISESHQWQIWKTIKLGVGPKTAEDFRKELEANGFKIGDWVNDILGKSSSFPVAIEENEVDLVVVSVAELGFKNEVTYEQIYKRAKELSLDLCPAEVGPQLRLQYKDQPNDEKILIGMEPITTWDGVPLVFSVCRDNLYSYLVNRYIAPPLLYFSSEYRWAFSRRK